MASPGRKAMPSHLAVVDKAHAHRHHDQPTPSSERPVPPDYLDDAEKVIFEQMVSTIEELYPPSESHVEMIALYAQNKLLAQFLDHKLKYEYRSTTYVTEDKFGNNLYKPYPEVQQLQVARRMCSDILREFGLSPSAQRNVKVEKKKTVSNAFAKLHGKVENE